MQHDYKAPHDYSTHKFNQSRYSPPESPRQLPAFVNAADGTMSHSHRGLPPPLGMSMPNSERRPSVVATLGNLPAPPTQWTGHDESMRNWLQAKAEEDRRKQEEERTKQETLKLDQRKIEQTMLRDSLQGGIPPPMVPLIFAAMGGSNFYGHTLEWAQQYMAQLSLQNQAQQQQIQAQQQQIQQQQQPQAPASPDLRPGSRMIPPNPYAAPAPIHQQQLQATPLPASQSRTLQHVPQSTTPLSRLNTGDIQSQPLPPASSSSRYSVHPLQQTQTAQSDSASGTGLFFHHWVPPSNTSTPNAAPPTPLSKSQQGSPFERPPNSHLRSEYQNSPKKRKVAGGNGVHHNHVPPPSQRSDLSPPPSSHQEYSPDMKLRDREHSREPSNASSREMENRTMARPSSRQKRLEESSAGHHYSQRPYVGSLVNGAGNDHPTR